MLRLEKARTSEASAGRSPRDCLRPQLHGPREVMSQTFLGNGATRGFRRSAVHDHRVRPRDGALRHARALPESAPDGRARRATSRQLRKCAGVGLPPDLRRKGRDGRNERSVARSVVDKKEQAGHQLLVDAMLAVRHTRDFRRAGVLLEDYLAKYPRGALREEAMALAVEAAAARTDLARRDFWVSAYLKDYPAGCFRAFMEGSRADRK